MSQQAQFGAPRPGRRAVLGAFAITMATLTIAPPAMASDTSDSLASEGSRTSYTASSSIPDPIAPRIDPDLAGTLPSFSQPVANKDVPPAPPSIEASSTLTEFFSVASFPSKDDHLKIELAFTKHRLCADFFADIVEKQNKHHGKAPSKIVTYWKVVSVTAPDGGKVKVEMQLVRVELTYPGFWRDNVDVFGWGPGAGGTTTVGLLRP